MEPDVFGAVGHTVRLAAPKVHRDGSHKFCRPFVVKESTYELSTRQDKVDSNHKQNSRFEPISELGNRSPNERHAKNSFEQVQIHQH